MKLKVYVIDDDPSTYESLRMSFAEAQRFRDAESFLAQIDASVAEAVVIADVHLRGIGGIELIGKLRDRGFATPVIVVSNVADVATAVRAIRSGAADFIEKPVPGSLLARRIHRSDMERRGFVHKTTGSKRLVPT